MSIGLGEGTCTAIKQTTLEAVVAKLSGAVNTLHSEYETLSQKLEPILRPDTEAREDDGEDAVPFSPHVLDLVGLKNTILQLSSRMAGLNERLDC